jgi:hypothetical protein
MRNNSFRTTAILETRLRKQVRCNSISHGAPLIGRTADRFGARRNILVVLLLTIVSFVVMYLWGSYQAGLIAGDFAPTDTTGNMLQLLGRCF